MGGGANPGCQQDQQLRNWGALREDREQTSASGKVALIRYPLRSTHGWGADLAPGEPQAPPLPAQRPKSGRRWQEMAPHPSRPEGVWGHPCGVTSCTPEHHHDAKNTESQRVGQ